MIQTNQSDTEIRMKYERSFTRWKEMPIATIPTPNGIPPTDTLPAIPPRTLRIPLTFQHAMAL